MISCRYLNRVDTVWKFANPFVKSNPQYLQRCRFYNGFSSYWIMDPKKRKTVTPVWRPVSTRSTSHDVSLVTQVKAESQNPHNSNDGRISEIGIQVEEVKLKVSNDRNACDEVEVVNEPVDPNFSSTTLQDTREGRTPEGGYVPSNEKHLVSVEAGASLIWFIKGKGGSTQKTIEEDLGVKIIFPSSKKEDYITIEGNSADSVAKASETIKGIIDEAVKSPALQYSHFVSLPLAIHPELVDKLFNFQSSILGINNSNQGENLDSSSNEDTSDEEDRDQQLNEAPHVTVELKTEEDNQQVKVAITNIPIVSYPPKKASSKSSSYLEDLGIDKSIFIKPQTFHLTVLMLKLWNKDRVDAAAEVLQSVSSKIMDALDNRPVSIRLKGLMTMRGPLAKARVLYAPVEEVGGEDRLMRACQVIIDEFVKAGLVLERDAQQKLKLHATVMNARHRKWKKGTRRKADSFDARGIVKQYGSEEWGEYLIREAHLSQRFAFDEKGYYHCCGSVPFPENMQLD